MFTVDISLQAYGLSGTPDCKVIDPVLLELAKKPLKNYCLGNRLACSSTKCELVAHLLSAHHSDYAVKINAAKVIKGSRFSVRPCSGALVSCLRPFDGYPARDMFLPLEPL